MISVDQRNKLILVLHDHLKIPVIPSDEDEDIPPRPYVVYSIIRDNGSNGQDSITHRVDKETQFVSPSQPIETEVFYKEYENQKEGTFSFTIHSESRDQARTICNDLKEYFERVGRIKIYDAGFAVIDVSAVQNRSVILGDHYERRVGMDIRLRYMDRSEYLEESIEEINI